MEHEHNSSPTKTNKQITLHGLELILQWYKFLLLKLYFLKFISILLDKPFNVPLQRMNVLDPLALDILAPINKLS